MRAWSDSIDPKTIPDEVLRAERGRRNSLRRVNPSGGRNGGRPLSCECGACETCERRRRRASALEARRQGSTD